MRFASLGSGSRGNATLVEADDSCVLVDCGFSLRETVRRLALLGRAPEDLTAILVTHEHGDHLRGVATLARRYGLPVYATPGTARGETIAELTTLCPVDLRQSFAVGALDVLPVAVPHDAREPCQYVFRHRGRTLGVLTDLGCVTPQVQDSYRQCDALMLECNHDVAMLATGPYPAFLKRRVGGDFGHLNNLQAAGLLAALEQARLQHLVLSHISEKNNTRQRAEAAVQAVLTTRVSVFSADQASGFAWREIV
ncbi:MAG: MBL fold metallo-hydrolase [Spongiibacteraceae bacterium]|jgi:phosphoribosyl 1,2-cyclic phosphodiesterase|nr:MBL fold metallo-hydrolase [Spongiibacteraceae bacterium]